MMFIIIQGVKQEEGGLVDGDDNEDITPAPAAVLDSFEWFSKLPPEIRILQMKSDPGDDLEMY